MPKMTVRKAADAPAPVHTNKAMLERQRLYEGFIAQATGNVGEITLEANDAIRSVKVKLRRAATRTGAKLEIWDADGSTSRRKRPAPGEDGRARLGSLRD